jgi:hypothetical protein
MRMWRAVGFGQSMRPLVSIATVLFAVLPCAEAVDAPSVTMTAAKTRIVVDEPVVVTVTFSGFRDVYLGQSLARDNPYFAVLIDRGAGYSPFSYKLFMSTNSEPSGRRPLKGKPLVMDVPLSFDNTLGDWAFPKPGRYSVVAEYRHSAGATLRSNVINITAVAPTGEEAEAHEALKPLRSTTLVEVEMGPANLGKLASYAERFPRSVYLQRARVQDLEYRIDQAREGRDPDGQEGPVPTARDAVRELSAKYMARLLPLAEELAGIEGSFQPRALFTLALVQNANGDKAGRKRTLERLVAEFPGRWNAQEARKELEAERRETDEEAQVQRPR